MNKKNLFAVVAAAALLLGAAQASAGNSHGGSHGGNNNTGGNSCRGSLGAIQAAVGIDQQVLVTLVGYRLPY